VRPLKARCARPSDYSTVLAFVGPGTAGHRAPPRVRTDDATIQQQQQQQQQQSMSADAETRS